MMLRGLRLGTGFGGSDFAGAPALTASVIDSAGVSVRVHSKNWSLAVRRASGVLCSPTMYTVAPRSRSLRHK
jgi:hypothetical protein